MKPNPPEPPPPPEPAPQQQPLRSAPLTPDRRPTEVRNSLSGLPTGGGSTDDRPLCRNPGCTRRVERALRGRPRKYCRDACRSASRSARTARTSPNTGGHDAYAWDVLTGLRERTAALGRLLGQNGGDLLERIIQAHQLTRDADELVGAVVQQARDRRVPMRDIAAALNISPDTVRRHWPPRRVDERMRDRRSRGQPTPPDPGDPGAPPGPRERRGSRDRSPDREPGREGGGERKRREGGARRTPGGDARSRGPDAGPPASPRPVRTRANPLWAGGDAPPDDRATVRLARALSHLQRASGKPLRALGVEAQVSASYVSRVMSGERCPSWDVTRRLIAACDGDPAELRPLWVSARGLGYPARELPNAATLHAALRGLHLAAARPDPATICRSSLGRLTPEGIAQLLHGPQVPDWQTVDCFVHAVHGCCDEIRPLWEAVAAQARLTPAEPGPSRRNTPNDDTVAHDAVTAGSSAGSPVTGQATASGAATSGFPSGDGGTAVGVGHRGADHRGVRLREPGHRGAGAPDPGHRDAGLRTASSQPLAPRRVLAPGSAPAP